MIGVDLAPGLSCNVAEFGASKRALSHLAPMYVVSEQSGALHDRC